MNDVILSERAARLALFAVACLAFSAGYWTGRCVRGLR